MHCGKSENSVHTCGTATGNSSKSKKKISILNFIFVLAVASSFMVIVMLILHCTFHILNHNTSSLNGKQFVGFVISEKYLGQKYKISILLVLIKFICSYAHLVKSIIFDLDQYLQILFFECHKTAYKTSMCSPLQLLL